MYYLRTKSAVDAIKFTLDNEKTTKSESDKSKQTVAAVKVPEATAAVTAAMDPQTNPAAAVEPLSPAELKQMLEQSKKSEDDDCLMCGS